MSPGIGSDIVGRKFLLAWSSHTQNSDLFINYGVVDRVRPPLADSEDEHSDREFAISILKCHPKSQRSISDLLFRSCEFEDKPARGVDGVLGQPVTSFPQIALRRAKNSN